MSFPVVDRPPPPALSFTTSGGGPIQRAYNWVLSIGDEFAFSGTTGSETPNQGIDEIAAEEQTNSGLSIPRDTTATASAAVTELRRRSGLTWDQLARLFGVTRRSLHSWASGKALNAANEERLNRILAVVRYIDRGNAQATRTALITALDDDVTPFDLLAADKFDEVKERLGAGPQRAIPKRPPLSAAARTARMPPRPDELVGALHDSVHREVGKSRVVRKAKVGSDR